MSLRRTALAGVLGVSMLVGAPLATGTAHAADAPPVADPIGAGKVCEGAPETSPFEDTDQETAGTAAAIRCLVATGVTTGITPDTYGPGEDVTRRQMALFVKRLADLLDDLDLEGELTALPVYDGVPDYPDVVREDPKFREAIGQLDQAGIVGGRADGRFDPGAPVSRRQMAAFVNRLQAHLVGEAFPDDADHFTDDDGDPGEANLDALASVGIFQGEGDGRVVPGGDISRRQMANVLLRHAQVLFARDLIVAPFVPPSAPARPAAQSRGTTVTVTYSRPATNPGTTSYGLERVRVDVGPDGTCVTEDDVPGTTFHPVADATEAQGREAGTWTFTADDVERGCYRFRVVARALGGASAASPVTSPSTWVSSASDSTAPSSVDAFVSEGDGEPGVLDARDVITIAFSEYIRLAPGASLTVLDGDGTYVEILGDGTQATFVLNDETVQLGGIEHLPGRVLSIRLNKDLEPAFAGLVAGVQLPARVVGADGISDAAGNAWSPSPLSGGDTVLDVPDPS